MKSFHQFGPFLGVVTSLDPEMIPENAAADMRNVTVEDGRLTPRYGYRNLSGSPSGFQNVYGFDYLQGYNASNDLEQEYISFEERSGTIYPYSVNVSSGARTQITNNGSNQALTAPTYGDQPGIKSFSFNGKAYSISPNDTPCLYQHEIGTNTSFIPMAPPKTPTKAPVIQLEPYATDSATTNVYLTLCVKYIIALFLRVGVGEL